MDATHENARTDDEPGPGRGDSRDYELLDFGRGRKLERFGEYVLDRPGVGRPDDDVERPELWSHATARFEIDANARASATSGQRGKWKPNAPLSPGMAVPGLGGSLVGQTMLSLPERWTIACGGLRLELKPTAFGHIGLFPEQIENWRWIARQLREPSRQRQSSERRPKILNLFAHTGGSTLTAAAAGAEVVHVDSARGAVTWARRNAELSGLTEAPIRWIVEDAVRFVRRELARCNGYDAVILDPPSYGHGAAGETWKLERDLPELLAACAKLTSCRLRFALLTCHSPAATPPVAAQWLGTAMNVGAEGRELSLTTSTGRQLPAGVVASVVA
jgi:23S rRNA (cytosine1962-C5)-methyltransferase